MPTHTGNHPVWVLAHESQEELAKAVVACCEEWQQKAKGQWKAMVESEPKVGYESACYVMCATVYVNRHNLFNIFLGKF